MSVLDNKIYRFDKISVFFKHTDYYGFVHSYNYFEWMSYTREAFFQEIVTEFMSICNQNIKMVTACTELEVLEDAAFGDKVLVEIYSEQVRRLSFDVVFKFTNLKTSKKLAFGRQTLTFIDAERGKLTKIPDELKGAVLAYEKK